MHRFSLHPSDGHLPGGSPQNGRTWRRGRGRQRGASGADRLAALEEGQGLLGAHCAGDLGPSSWVVSTEDNKYWKGNYIWNTCNRCYCNSQQSSLRAIVSQLADRLTWKPCDTSFTSMWHFLFCNRPLSWYQTKHHLNKFEKHTHIIKAPCILWKHDTCCTWGPLHPLQGATSTSVMRPKPWS